MAPTLRHRGSMTSCHQRPIRKYHQQVTDPTAHHNNAIRTQRKAFRASLTVDYSLLAADNTVEFHRPNAADANPVPLQLVANGGRTSCDSSRSRICTCCGDAFALSPTRPLAIMLAPTTMKDKLVRSRLFRF
jgi:hypothetical protein